MQLLPQQISWHQSIKGVVVFWVGACVLLSCLAQDAALQPGSRLEELLASWTKIALPIYLTEVRALTPEKYIVELSVILCMQLAVNVPEPVAL